jgi:hypothetical protein
MMIKNIIIKNRIIKDMMIKNIIIKNRIIKDMMINGLWNFTYTVYYYEY